jgi:hypothetical protein
MNTPRLICLVASSLYFNAPHPAEGATNEWIKPTSGYWEEASWSLGVLPSFEQDPVAFRNPGFKALGIGANTTANFSNSLHLNYLTVDAPSNSANQLLLNYAGLNVPLFVNSDFVLGTNGSVVSYFSALRGGNFYVSGPATFSENSQVTFGSIHVGVDAAATVGLNNSSLSADLFVVGQNTNTGGTVTQNGGSSQVTNLQMSAGSAYNLTNGTLFAITADLQFQTGASGLGQFTEAGGDVEIGDLRMGVQTFYFPEGRGEFLLTSGLFRCTNLSLLTGSFSQSGGTNITQRIALPWLYSAFAEYFLSSGILISSNLTCGYAGGVGFPGRGNFVQSGGSHTNSSMTLWGDTRHQSVTVYGSYSLNSGLLVCGAATMLGGNFSQSGGTNYTQEILLDGAGSFVLSGGELVSSNVTMETFGCTESVFIQNNGNHHIQNRLKLDNFVRYELRDGTLTVTNIDIGPGAQFVLLGGSISNAGIFIIRSGAFRVGGLTQQLGQLQVLGVEVTPCTYPQPTVPTLDVRYGGSTTSTVLHFRDSRDVPWSGANLSIVHWSASTNGAGPHHVFVGTNAQGLTASQVSQVTFVNPVGWPAGNYPARILSNGEIIPTVLPPLTFASKPDAFILSWAGDYSLLSATNVTGPYVPIPGATNPFTNAFVGPQRFFRLGLIAP